MRPATVGVLDGTDGGGREASLGCGEHDYGSDRRAVAGEPVDGRGARRRQCAPRWRRRRRLGTGPVPDGEPGRRGRMAAGRICCAGSRGRRQPGGGRCGGGVVVMLDADPLGPKSPRAERGLPLDLACGAARGAGRRSGRERGRSCRQWRAGRPWSPAHLRAEARADGGFDLSWIARSRIDGDRWEGEPVSADPIRFRIRIVAGPVQLRVFEVDGDGGSLFRGERGDRLSRRNRPGCGGRGGAMGRGIWLGRRGEGRAGLTHRVFGGAPLRNPRHGLTDPLGIWWD